MFSDQLDWLAVSSVVPSFPTWASSYSVLMSCLKLYLCSNSFLKNWHSPSSMTFNIFLCYSNMSLVVCLSCTVPWEGFMLTLHYPGGQGRDRLPPQHLCIVCCWIFVELLDIWEPRALHMLLTKHCLILISFPVRGFPVLCLSFSLLSFEITLPVWVAYSWRWLCK